MKKYFYVVIAVIGLCFAGCSSFSKNNAPYGNQGYGALSSGGGVAAGNAEVGKKFAKEKQLVKFQENLGFVPLGKFNVRFPATIASVETAKNEITFEFKNTQHNYPDFNGYELKVVRLKTKRDEGVYVFRSYKPAFAPETVTTKDQTTTEQTATEQAKTDQATTKQTDQINQIDKMSFDSFVKVKTLKYMSNSKTINWQHCYEIDRFSNKGHGTLTVNGELVSEQYPMEGMTYLKCRETNNLWAKMQGSEMIFGTLTKLDNTRESIIDLCLRAHYPSEPKAMSLEEETIDGKSFYVIKITEFNDPETLPFNYAEILLSKETYLPFICRFIKKNPPSGDTIEAFFEDTYYDYDQPLDINPPQEVMDAEWLQPKAEK